MGSSVINNNSELIELVESTYYNPVVYYDPKLNCVIIKKNKEVCSIKFGWCNLPKMLSIKYDSNNSSYYGVSTFCVNEVEEILRVLDFTIKLTKITDVDIQLSLFD